MKINTDIPKLKNQVVNYVCKNIKEYMLILLLLIIGIFIGVMIINNCNQEQTTEINNYIYDFITNFKNIEKIDKISLLMSSIKNNIILTLIIWLAGTTVIGVPIVLLVIWFRGLCIGYTISAIACTLGKMKGLMFGLSALFLQNILFIPALLSLGVSSIKLYKAIIKDKRKENIKIEIIKHTIFSLLMLAIFILSSFIENFLSINLLQKVVKFF